MTAEDRTRLLGAATWLGVGGIVVAAVHLVVGAGAGFGGDGNDALYDVVSGNATAGLVLLLLAALLEAGGRTRRPGLVTAAGAGYLVAALLQLAQFGRGTNWLGGQGNTAAFLLGLGVAALTLGVTAGRAPSTVDGQQVNRAKG